MSDLVIDEDRAWELVRALTPGTVADPARARLPEAPDVWVEVCAAGRWKASSETTPAARDVFDIYLPLRVPAELVVGQLGQSLDGRIATETGASHFVTGPADILRLHRVRSLVDTVIVGAGTVEADDPRLTVRKVPGQDPVRVVLDPDRRLDPGRRVFTDGAAPTLVVRRGSHGEPSGGPVEELFVPAFEAGGLDLGALLRELRARGLRRILVEGGGLTVSGFLASGLLDRLHVTVAPLLIGSGRPSITLAPIGSLDQALRPRCRHFALGPDVLFDLDLRSGSA